jgi:hypothetical protein
LAVVQEVADEDVIQITVINKIIERYGSNFVGPLANYLGGAYGWSVAQALANGGEFPLMSPRRLQGYEEKLSQLLGDRLVSSLPDLTVRDAEDIIGRYSDEAKQFQNARINVANLLRQPQPLMQPQLSPVIQREFQSIQNEFSQCEPKITKQVARRSQCCQAQSPCCAQTHYRNEARLARRLARRSRALIRKIAHRHADSRRHRETREVLRRVFKRMVSLSEAL